MNQELRALQSAPAPADKTELLGRIEQVWTTLESALAGLSETQLLTLGDGGWTTIDNLAHLQFWEQFMLRHYLAGEPAHEIAGVDASTFAGLDTDRLNALVYERNHGRPPGEVQADLQRSHDEVVRTLEATPWSELMRQNLPDDPEARPVLLWVTGNTYEHYLEHLEIIERLTGVGANP